jgi:DNA-binding NarL/FixJ family response regulator
MLEIQKIKILIADDHDIVLEGYKSILSEIPNMEVVGKAANGKEVLYMLQSHLVDIVLMDLNMPQMDGIEATEKVKALFPNVKILVLTMLGDSMHIKKLVDLGVDGYLLKNSDKATLIRAIESIYEGKPFFDGEVTKTILNRFKQKIEIDDEEVFLSDRELEIITQIALGLSTLEISEKLFISPHTVKTHRKNINFKLGIHNPAELLIFAKKKNLIS